MSVRVLSAASTSKLIALSTVKDRLGITDSSQDVRLGELIAEASSAIEDYVGRSLGRQQYQETLSGNDRLRLGLSRFPVDADSVTLTIDGTAETDFSVEDPSAGILWRENTWTSDFKEIGQREEENVSVTYKAGYILPDQITNWLASTAVASGAWVRPTTPVKDFLFEVTTAGTTGSSEPSWPTTAGGTKTDGTAVFTARHALELPKAIQSAAWLAVHELHTSMTRGLGVRAVESDGQRVEYQSSFGQQGGLPVGVMRLLDGWKYA